MECVRERIVVGGAEYDVYMEVEPRIQTTDIAHADDIAGVQKKALTKGLELLRVVGSEVGNAAKHVLETSKPDEIECKLGVKFDAEVGALITKTAAGASLELCMKWKLAANQD